MTPFWRRSLWLLPILMPGPAHAAETRVPIEITFLPAPPDPAGFDVYSRADETTPWSRRRYEADATGGVATRLDCTGTTQVMIDPWDSRYSRPSDFCESDGVSLVAVYSAYARQLWDSETGAPLTDYAEALRPALQLALAPPEAPGVDIEGRGVAGGIAMAGYPTSPAAVSEDWDADADGSLSQDQLGDHDADADGSLSEDEFIAYSTETGGSLRDRLASALEAGDWAEAAATARQAQSLAVRAGDDRRVAALETLAAETSFRAAGVAIAGQGYFVPTPEGAVLSDTGRVLAARLDPADASGAVTTGVASAAAPRLATAGDLRGLAVYDADGMDIGEIEELVMTADGVVSVVSVGGFLGMGEKPVAIDLGALKPAGDGVIISEMGGADIKAMADYDFTGTPVPDDTRLREIWRRK